MHELQLHLPRRRLQSHRLSPIVIISRLQTDCQPVIGQAHVRATPHYWCLRKSGGSQQNVYRGTTAETGGRGHLRQRITTREATHATLCQQPECNVLTLTFLAVACSACIPAAPTSSARTVAQASITPEGCRLSTCHRTARRSSNTIVLGV